MIDQVVFSSIHIFPYPRLRQIVSSSISLATAVCSCRAALFCVTVSSIEFSVAKSPKQHFCHLGDFIFYRLFFTVFRESSSSNPHPHPLQDLPHQQFSSSSSLPLHQHILILVVHFIEFDFFWLFRHSCIKLYRCSTSIPVPAGISLPMITFSFRPIRWSSLPLILASVRTLVVSRKTG